MLITIVTPLYNRAHLIGKLYESLKRQNGQFFQWIVVDDGSSDHPEYLFSEWMKEENNFKITFLQTENGGKHRALNKGIEYSEGDYTMVCDSDDYLCDDAIELVEKWIIETRELNLYGFAGMKCNEKSELALWYTDDFGKQIKFGGSPKFKNYADATPKEAVTKYGLFGDKTEVLKTKIWKKYPFPEFEGENFLTEMVVWNRISADGGLIRWYDSPIEVVDYLDGGLSDDNTKFFRNPKGYAEYVLSEDPISNSVEQLEFRSIYYTHMLGSLTESDIAKNLRMNDCSSIKKYIIEKKQHRLEILKILKDCARLLNNTKNGDNKENIDHISSTIFNLLKKIKVHEDEINSILYADFNIVIDAIEKQEQQLKNEIKGLG